MERCICWISSFDAGSLQGRQDILNSPLINMVDDVHVVIAFDSEITKTTILQDSHARFFWHDIAYDCFHLLIPPVRAN